PQLNGLYCNLYTSACLVQYRKLFSQTPMILVSNIIFIALTTLASVLIVPNLITSAIPNFTRAVSAAFK
ncbi:MAG: hypothetical protein ACI83B_003694, partial [Sediminicola sp.]